ncbi:MAG: hypothetical protein COU47_00460 [Candidatus Niyogibacteria bacterium CG10_big_fil_rev_8_21_14_0_10_46_36]|uniref:Uncharacterized protein n=1 Tax=Candidatus Niyogibacteria bacterium CG10_big_fil_rev_8_21_14_0_10_46_36 TaxID=1974726 RepID=A0A2H0TEC7_9BACT|nr:MAG: hypothetical protein COU47_00460 [Candidatus Niyogibacteria bacterium CG10_big_fil_rev_8_21_14_0_10_46_36]
MDLKKIHPDAITFGAVACCALANLQSDASEIQEAYRTRVPRKEWVAGFLSIFRDTTQLIFIPTETHKDFYMEVIEKEFEALKTTKEDALVCGHTPSEHIEALCKVLHAFNRGEIH